jgi:hypothetical protein
MRAFSVGTTAVKIADYNISRRFLTVQPVDGNIYIKYDGDEAALTASNGQRVDEGTIFAVVNRPGKAFSSEVWAVAAEGTVDVRVQGQHAYESE